MAATKADRGRATRIRKKGAKATRAERKWLREYEAARKAERAKRSPIARDDDATTDASSSGWQAPPSHAAEESERAHEPKLELDPSTFMRDDETPVEVPPAAATEVAIVFDGAGRDDAERDEAERDDAERDDDDDAENPGTTCTIPNCPACRKARGGGGLLGGEICVATGQRVWAPPSLKACEGMASTFLFVLSMGIRFVRPDRRLVPPTAEERRDLAEAIYEVAKERAAWLGAGADIFLLARAVGRYAMRAMRDDGQPDELSALRARLAAVEAERDALARSAA